MGRFKLEKNPNSHDLPKEYQEVEYLESTGIQYIDTGVIGKFGLMSETKATFEQEITSSTNANLLSCRNGNTRFYLGHRIYQNEFKLGIVTEIGSNVTPIKSEIYTITSDVRQNPAKLIINGEEKISQNVDQVNTNLNLYLFKNNYSSDNPWIGKLYYCKIWSGDELVRDFIPCYRKADNVIGMYDLVNDVFYTNAGTGEFTKGNDINKYEAIPCDRYYLEINPNAHNLPSAYQEVEYLESTGTQYIDTGVTVAPLTCKMKIEMTDTSAGVVMGSYSANITKRLYFGTAQNIWSVGSYGRYVDLDVSSIGMQELIYEYDNTSIKFFKNGVRVYNSNIQPDYDNLPSLTIFARKAYDTINAYSKLKLYSFEIYNNESLIRDFVPCYRKADNEAGLYDLANGVFYTNAGTGNFLKGNDINNYKAIPCNRYCLELTIPKEFQKVEYIESSGTQYINTGILPELNIKTVSKLRSSSNTGCLLGGYGIDGVLTHRFDLIYVNNGYFALGDTQFHNTSKICELNTDYIVEGYIGDDEQYLKIDGVDVYNGTSQITYGESTNTLTLFARRTPTEISVYFRGKCYYSKIYINNELIREFIPCYRKADNIVGMYDIVNDVFYTNAGSGSFTKGNNINNYKIIQIL